MRRLTLTRFASTKDGVFGRLGDWYTIEEEHQGNRPNISCIPAGTYDCTRSTYNRGGYETFEVLDVPKRTFIKFHIANTEEDLNGCIGLGMDLGVLSVTDEDSRRPAHKLAVLRSRTAFTEFITSLDGVDQFVLEIIEYGE